MDYAEWHEATTGDQDYEGLFDADFDAQRASEYQERDAVLCLVDCQSSMFQRYLCERREYTLSDEGHATALEGEPGARCAAVPTGQKELRGPGETPFALAMRCVLRLYQDKVVTANKDIVGLVLYNCCASHNVYDFNGVYVLHSFTRPGASEVHELKLLQLAGDPSSAGYHDFCAKIGHGLPASSQTFSGQRPARAPPRLSDALWAVQHMFLSLKSSVVKYRRLFFFTNDDNPCVGDELERDRCAARVTDLREAGVVLEVFVFGAVRVSHSKATSSNSSLDVTRESFRTREEGGATWMASLASSSNVTSSDLATAFSSVCASACRSVSSVSHVGRTRPEFAKPNFWEWIIHTVARRAGSDSNSRMEGASVGFTAQDPTRDYSGGVYVSCENEGFDMLLSTVKRKTHPQRPTLSCPLFLGVSGHSRPPAPKMAVSLFHPIMPAQRPKAEWLDGVTNQIVKRETRLLCATQSSSSNACRSRPRIDEGDIVTSPQLPGEGKVERYRSAQRASFNAQEEAAAGSSKAPHKRSCDSKGCEDGVAHVEVSPQEVDMSVIAGGTRLCLSMEERRAIVATAAAGAPYGITIVCFKHLESVLRHKHMLKRAGFLHPNLRDGGTASLRLFVQLHRTLTKQGKVAIAQAILKKHGAPRLVALVASPTWPSSQLAALPIEREVVGTSGTLTATSLANSLPTEGLGFYVVPLPYAEDIRSVPFRTRGRELVGDSTLVGVQDGYPEAVAMAKQIVRALSVDYDILAVPNPSLQRQYALLQKLALKNDSRAAGLAKQGPSGVIGGNRTFFYPTQDGGERLICEVEDLTLPDSKGMSQYRALFDEFVLAVFPRPRSAAAVRSARSTGANEAGPGSKGAGCLRSVEARETAAEWESTDGVSGDDELRALVELKAARNQLQTLTIPQIKAFLAMSGVPASGATRKDDYLDLLEHALHPASP